MHRLVLSAVALVLAFASPLALRAQESSKLAFPSDPSMWINSAPITLEALQGKAALLWFYEEDCPRCRAKWPEMIALSSKFAGQPIVFIAVNSAKKGLGSTSRSARTSAVNRLKKLAQDSPDSDAGQQAAQLLQQIGEM